MRPTYSHMRTFIDVLLIVFLLQSIRTFTLTATLDKDEHFLFDRIDREEVVQSYRGENLSDTDKISYLYHESFIARSR